MQITFNANNADEVKEVLTYLETMNLIPTVAPKEAQEETKPTKKPKPKVEPKAEVLVSLGDLKAAAKAATLKVERPKVKATIGKYGEKLSEVSEADYEALLNDLKKLGE